MPLFDGIGEGWTLIEALELQREIEGPAPWNQAEPLRVVRSRSQMGSSNCQSSGRNRRLCLP